MSLTREVTVWCDAEGCPPRWEQSSEGAKELRRVLRGRGWTRDGGKDFCPVHSASRRKARGQ